MALSVQLQPERRSWYRQLHRRTRTQCTSDTPLDEDFDDVPTPVIHETIQRRSHRFISEDVHDSEPMTFDTQYCRSHSLGPAQGSGHLDVHEDDGGYCEDYNNDTVVTNGHVEGDDDLYENVSGMDSYQSNEFQRYVNRSSRPDRSDLHHGCDPSVPHAGYHGKNLITPLSY